MEKTKPQITGTNNTHAVKPELRDYLAKQAQLKPERSLGVERHTHFFPQSGDVCAALAIFHTLYAKNQVLLTLVSLTQIAQTKSSATTIWFQLFSLALSF